MNGMRLLSNLLHRLTRNHTDECAPEGDHGAVQDAARVRHVMRRVTDERSDIDAVIAELQARVLNDQRRPE